MKWFQTAQREISDRVRRLRATDVRQKPMKRKEAEPLRESLHGSQRDLATTIERQIEQADGRASVNGQHGCAADVDVFCATATTAAARAATVFRSHPTMSASERPVIHRSRTFTDGSTLRGDGPRHTKKRASFSTAAQAAAAGTTTSVAAGSGSASGQSSSPPHLLRTASTASAAAYGAVHQARTPRARRETPVEPSTADTAVASQTPRSNTRPSPSTASGATSGQHLSPLRLLRTASTASAAAYRATRRARTPRVLREVPVKPSTADTAVASQTPSNNTRLSPSTASGATSAQLSSPPRLLRTASTASAAAYGAAHKARTSRVQREMAVEPFTADTVVVSVKPRKKKRPSPSTSSGVTSGQPSSRPHLLRTASTASAAAYDAVHKARTPRARREMPVEPFTVDTAVTSVKPRKNTQPSSSTASKEVAGIDRALQHGSTTRPGGRWPSIAASRPVQDIIRWPLAFPVAGTVTVGDTPGSGGSITPPRPSRRSSSKRSDIHRRNSVPDISRPADAAAVRASGGCRRNSLPDISLRGIARRPPERRPPANTRKRKHRLGPRSSSFSSAQKNEAPRLPGYFEAVEVQRKIDGEEGVKEAGRRDGGTGTSGTPADVAGGGMEKHRQRRASRRDLKAAPPAPHASQASQAAKARQAPQASQTPQGAQETQGAQGTQATPAKRATRASQAPQASRAPKTSQRANEEGEDEQKSLGGKAKAEDRDPGDLRRALSLGSALLRAFSQPLDNEPEPGFRSVGHTTRDCKEPVRTNIADSSGGGDVLPSTDASSRARSTGGAPVTTSTERSSAAVVAKIAKIEVGMIVARGAAAAAAAGIHRTPAGFLDPPPEGVPVADDSAFSYPSPPCWVTRYLNFGSTYGLVYLLSDGSVGLLFKDNTKMVVDPEGVTINYEEPPPTAAARLLSPQSSIHEAESGAGRRAKRALNGRTRSHQYRLDSFPFYLRKKVNILRYFRGIMLYGRGDRGGYEGRGSEVRASEESRRGPLTFVEKWQHAGDTHCFQLSGHTVQVLFSDGTEIMLSKESDPELVTFVSRDGRRETQPRQNVKHRKDVMKRVHCAEDFMFLMMETP